MKIENRVRLRQGRVTKKGGGKSGPSVDLSKRWRAGGGSLRTLQLKRYF